MRQQVATEPEPAVEGGLSSLYFEEQECAKVLAALRRREPFADVAAAYQLGMRLARAAALSLQGCPGLTAASCGASGEGAWEALVAAHDPSGWQDPASPPLPPPGSVAGGRVPQDHLGGWWKAAVAWAGLHRRQGGRPGPYLGLGQTAKLISIRRPVFDHILLPGGTPTLPTGAVAAARAGQLRAFEGLIRHPDALRFMPRQGLLPVATWTDLLTHSQAADVASLAGTVAKLLRRRPSPEEGLGGVTALARRFGLMAGRDAPAEGLQRRHVAVQAAAGGVGAIPAVGSAAASGDGSGARPDLPLSAACIALQLLPEAARVGRALAEAVLPRLSAPAPPPELRPLEDLVALLLDWMPPLVLAARTLELSKATGEGARPRAGAESREVAAAATPAQAAPAAGAWDKLLWRQLDPAWALAAALRLVPTCSCPWELERPETGPGACTLLGPSIRLLREALGPGGACEEPQLLTQLEALSACSRLSEAADLGRGLGASPGPAQLYAGATAVLASPAEARRALPGCSNPACTNLAGPAEAALRLRHCGGCGGAARYCCEGCRQAHWAAGHAEECGAAAGSSQAGGQGG
ncbi:hypothetical protein HYH03_006793 [Edaphochlamys debaryana]|uniref:phytol kinase n=1 Tax=Edaphochlamys debaryana TaxID=47281 RepID=A0A835Y4U5_9CHLO|nr:hypothetical protein HYH03_006793 [Edaphochlamys debaryana]|eukprot:KAG2495187.1 hypothetical protein HYH03_006793 [Edaphochlamys debaryana]